MDGHESLKGVTGVFLQFLRCFQYFWNEQTYQILKVFNDFDRHMWNCLDR